LRLIPDEEYVSRDPMDPTDRILASGYAVADAAGNKLSWEQVTSFGLYPFPLELDDPWDDRITDQRLDPGRLLKLTPEPKARPIPRVGVWDADGVWRIGYLGVSYWGGGDGGLLVRDWRVGKQVSAIVLHEAILDGKRWRVTLLVGPPSVIASLANPLET
jgi:hypothetical protein